MVFSLFKKKNKIDEIMNKSIDDYLKKIKKSETLKKSDLSSISDEDLRTVVMSWMWGKFNKDWTNQYEVIESLPKPCQNVYACCTVSDEINNGGLNQLFFNSTGNFVKVAQEGFTAMGSEKISNIIKEAIDIYEKNSEVFEKHNDVTIENFLGSYNEKLFDELDNNFLEEEVAFDKLLINYIRKNENFFGD